MWVSEDVAAAHVRVHISVVVDSRGVRIVPLQVGLGSLRRDKVLSVLQSLHAARMHTIVRIVLLPMLNLSLYVTIAI